MANAYWLSAILIPWLILSLVAHGTEHPDGLCRVSFRWAPPVSWRSAPSPVTILSLRIPEIPFVVAVVLSSICAAMVGIVFGLPSLRIRGLYLAVATLASQFFIVWSLDKFGWFKNYDPAGVITAQKIVYPGT